MKSASPTPPQFLLSDHFGSAPRSAKTKITINIVPSMFYTLLSCMQAEIFGAAFPRRLHRYIEMLIAIPGRISAVEQVIIAVF
jgi:hypothetical protein